LRVLALVDGEHYPEVTRWGIQSARSVGHEVLAAVFLGGLEKIRSEGLPDLGVPVIDGRGELIDVVGRVLDQVRPEAVLDLSDEPIVGYRERMEIAAVSLARGVPYVGSDFRLDPPIWGPVLPAPTLAVIGTGKRTGKTAIAGEVARTAARMDLKPIIVAMGRGGPPEPEVAEAGTTGVEALVEKARRGRHAASDFLEDAVTTGQTTIGARRCGGGLAGAPFVTNVVEAGHQAAARDPDVLILEGSGASIPPIPWDAGILVVPAGVLEEYVAGYLGPFRILLSDLVVVTMMSGPGSDPQKPFAFGSHVHRLNREARFVVTDFEPVPLGEVQGKSVFFTTTAPEGVASHQVASLEERAGCRVVGWSSHLADRAALGRDLEAAPQYDVLLTELKAAAVDVASESALKRGAGVVFVDNRASSVAGQPALSNLLEETIELARARYEQRREKQG
jgi:cyclic 2,3-diphosphoglycerate synthetase